MRYEAETGETNPRWGGPRRGMERMSCFVRCLILQHPREVSSIRYVESVAYSFPEIRILFDNQLKNPLTTKYRIITLLM
jgi:hypothetical protein